MFFKLVAPDVEKFALTGPNVVVDGKYRSS
jgi:hypothetical protein